jgi:predicted Zn-ribbon and HTH transcriptional regulator
MELTLTRREIERAIEVCYDDSDENNKLFVSNCSQCPVSRKAGRPSGCPIGESEETMREKFYGAKIKAKITVSTTDPVYKQRWIDQAVEDFKDPLYEDLKKVKESMDEKGKNT